MYKAPYGKERSTDWSSGAGRTREHAAPAPGPAPGMEAFGRACGRFWAVTVGFVLLGYLCMGRSFAYWGIRPANIFVGEIILGLFLLTRTGDILGRWFGALIAETKLNRLAWVYYLFASYGVIQVIRGLIAEHSVLPVLQNLAFNVYPLYLFIGLWAGGRYPNYLERFSRWLAWCNGIYGILYIPILNPMSWDGSGEVPLFGQPGGSAVAILGLLCFEPKLQRVVIPLLLNAFVMLGLQVRAEWLGFILGLGIWGILGKKVGRMMAGAGVIVVLLGVGYIADFSLPAPAGRGGQISTRSIIGRGLSAVDPEGAAKYAENADSTAGTVEWRRRWWRAIWDSIHETGTTTLFGHGYGYPITELVTYMVGEEDVRSPHNIFFFCLAYGGWIGVILFFAFQLTILRLHWLTHKTTKRPFGIVFLTVCVTNAFFSNFFETPFGAIPYYLITGLAIAPILCPKN